MNYLTKGERNYENRVAAVKELKKKEVEFTEHNEGRHLLVTGVVDVVDFWPGTGKWIARDVCKTRGCGVDKLLAYLGVK